MFSSLLLDGLNYALLKFNKFECQFTKKMIFNVLCIVTNYKVINLYHQWSIQYENNDLILHVLTSMITQVSSKNNYKHELNCNV